MICRDHLGIACCASAPLSGTGRGLGIQLCGVDEKSGCESAISIFPSLAASLPGASVPFFFLSLAWIAESALGFVEKRRLVLKYQRSGALGVNEHDLGAVGTRLGRVTQEAVALGLEAGHVPKDIVG